MFHATERHNILCDSTLISIYAFTLFSYLTRFSESLFCLFIYFLFAHYLCRIWRDDDATFRTTLMFHKRKRRSPAFDSQAHSQRAQEKMTLMNHHQGNEIRPSCRKSTSSARRRLTRVSRRPPRESCCPETPRVLWYVYCYCYNKSQNYVALFLSVLLPVCT